MMERYAYHKLHLVFLGKMKRQRTERLILNLETLKQLETMRKDQSLNLIMKSCLKNLEIIGHIRPKDAVPGSSPIQTIWKRKIKNALPLTPL